MRDNRVAYIKRQIEIMLKIIFYLSRVLFTLNVASNESSFRLIALRKKISRRKHCRFEIIKMIVELTNVMSLDFSFVTYDRESSFYRFNAFKFLKKLKSIDYH